MYDPETLRPPTEKDMRRRQLPLERIQLGHSIMCHGPEDPADRLYETHEYECGAHYHLVEVTASVAELVALCNEWGIPLQAEVVANGYDGELALDWTHLPEGPLD